MTSEQQKEILRNLREFQESSENMFDISRFQKILNIALQKILESRMVSESILSESILKNI